MTSAELDDLLKVRVKEGLHPEYKAGLKEKDFDAPGVVRENVSAFANSDGGVLFVGVDRKHKITGCDVQGGAGLSDWATRCLEHMVPYFSPQPRIHEIARASGPVLVI